MKHLSSTHIALCISMFDMEVEDVWVFGMKYTMRRYGGRYT